MKTIILAIVGSLAVVCLDAVAEAGEKDNGYTGVSIEEGHQMWQDGVYALDVRTPEEFGQGHIPNAHNINVTELENRIGELTGMENTDILVYCKAGTRSAQASAILVAHGFTKVFDMSGGFDAWSAAGYETETGDDTFESVSLEQAHQMWLDGVFVLDVRSALAFGVGHIPGSHNIPVNEVADRLNELAGLENESILVYCSSALCGNAEYAAGVLLKNGFKLVFVMPDGYEGWVAAGYELQANDNGFVLPVTISCTPNTTNGQPAGGDLLVLALTGIGLLGTGYLRSKRR